MKNKKKNQVKKMLPVTLLVIFIMLIAYHFPIKVNRHIEMLHIMIDDKDVKDYESIDLVGNEYKHFFSPTRFTGQIDFRGERVEWVDLPVNQFTSFVGVIDGKPVDLGVIYINEDVNQVTFLGERKLMDGSFTSDPNDYYTGPADTRSQAVQIINDHLDSDEIYKYAVHF